MKTGIELIAEEREWQISAMGWTADHDDTHTEEEMVSAAVAYAWNNEDMWPWEAEAWKPSDDQICNLTKAGALIAAEIDRLIRHNK